MIDSVGTRIAGIQARFGAPTAGAPPTGATDFGVLLDDAIAGAGASTAGNPASTTPGTIGAMLAAAARLGAPGAPTTGFPTGDVRLPETLSADLDQRRAELMPAFEEAGRRHGVDPNLLAAVAWTESNFDPTAVSPAGAIGLMQIMPGTAAELGVDPTDPLQAIDGAARYLRQAFDQFGDVRLALAAYNAGPGAVAQHGGIPPYPETITYVDRVLTRLETLTGATP